MNEPTHFGPVYGRTHGESLCLCQPGLVAGSSNTMTRSLKMVDCKSCDELIGDIVNLHVKRLQSSRSGSQT